MKLIALSFILLFIVIFCRSISISQAYQESLATEKAIIKFDPLTLVEEGYLRIKIKDIKPGDEEKGTFIPLIPNRPQRRFLQLFRKLQKTNQPIRIVILKARQWGGTTIVDAIMYALTAYQSNINSMIIADEKKGATYILGMAQNFQKSVEDDYPHLAISTVHNNKLELAFRDTRSVIFIESSENKDAGQKYTLHYLHCSEVSKFHYTDELFGGLLPAVSKAPGSIIVMESTANGIGDYFHSLCMQAEENSERFKDGDYSSYRGEWLLFFVPFMEHEEYSKPFENQEQRQSLINSLDDEEQALLKLQYSTIDGPRYTSLKNLNYRRWVLENDYKRDIDRLHEMMPTTVDEAFLASGRMAFDPKRCKEIYNYTLTQSYKIGILEPQKDNSKLINFFEQRNGEWKIWEFPPTERNPIHPVDYVLTVDPPGQKEIEGNVDGKKGDYGTIGIFRRRQPGELKDFPQVRLEQVAEFRSRMAPDLLADEAYHGALAYGIKMVFPEANSYGLTTIDHLKHRIGIYVRETYDEKAKKVSKKLGWYTGPGISGTKKLMITELAAAIRERTIFVRSTVMANELKTYIVAADGTTNAQEGCFDDTVIEAALAIQADLRTPRKSAYSQVIQVSTERGEDKCDC